jgi:hypothetical protein
MATRGRIQSSIQEAKKVFCLDESNSFTASQNVPPLQFRSVAYLVRVVRLRRMASTMELSEKTKQSLLSRSVNKRNAVLCLAFYLSIRATWTEMSGMQQWASPLIATDNGNGNALKSNCSLPFATNISAITASTKQKLVGIIQSNDTATMVLPKEADSQTKDFQNAAAYQTNNSSNSSKISHSVPDAISMAANTSCCSLHASGNFTRFAVPRALDTYSVFLSGYQQQSLDSMLGKEDDAICEFQGRFKFWNHFPHTMQQLYSCISWWNGHPSHPSVLAWSSKKHGKQLRSDRFVGGIIKSLVNNKNVTFLDLDTRPAPNNTVSKKPSSVPFLGYTVKSPTHLRAFRDATVQDLFPGRVTPGCPTKNTTNLLGDTASPRIGILNRRESRRLQTVDVLVHELGQAFPMSPITLKEFESANFADQVDFFSSIDILISPHGAQLTGLPFMPDCGGLIELFPKGYHIPNFFGSLAIASGLDYGYVYMSGGNATNETKVMSATKSGRGKARTVNLCPSSSKIVDAVRVMTDDWYQCCNRAAV